MKNETLHNCKMPDNIKQDDWGLAITECYEDKEGELWVTNKEYTNTVSFCPFCGYKSKAIKSKIIGLYSGKPLTLDCNISEIQTSVRLFNALCVIFGGSHNIKIGDIVSLQQDELMKIRNTGIKTWQELDRIKMALGY